MARKNAHLSTYLNNYSSEDPRGGENPSVSERERAERESRETGSCWFHADALDNDDVATLKASPPVEPKPKRQRLVLQRNEDKLFVESALKMVADWQAAGKYISKLYIKSVARTSTTRS